MRSQKLSRFSKGSFGSTTRAMSGKPTNSILRSIRARPEIVGYAHCQYINRAVKGWHPQVHLKQGLLNFDGTPKTVFVDAVTRANKAATSASALTSSAAPDAVRMTETEGTGSPSLR